jgi:pimeloyl-ACP methyl ester carboxylesterase
MEQMFAQGVVGYADDRLADGRGWDTFDVSAIECPVIVLHGKDDTFAPVSLAYHTARIVPGAALHVVDECGHFSILSKIPDAISEVLTRSGVRAQAAAR